MFERNFLAQFDDPVQIRKYAYVSTAPGAFQSEFFLFWCMLTKKRFGDQQGILKEVDLFLQETLLKNKFNLFKNTIH